MHVYNVAFGGSSLLEWTTGDEAQHVGQRLLSALRTIHSTFATVLWGLPEEDLCRSMKHFPEEAMRACYFEKFVEQHLRMREWLRGVGSSHVGREFRTLVRARLKVTNDAAAAGATVTHWASPAVIKDATDFTCIPSVGVLPHRECMVNAM